MRCQTAAVRSQTRPLSRVEARDPYDGLRPWSAVTHGAGAVLSVIGTAALLIGSARAGLWLRFVLFAVYGLSMIGLYTASTLYHCLNTSVPVRISLRKFDHCSIYLLIAGSYTPICLTVLRDCGGPLLLAAVWSVGIAGIVLTLIRLSIPRWLTSTLYLFMGWLAVFAISPIYRLLPAEGFFWLLMGGIMYSAGGILSALKWPGRDNPRFGFHEIFHVFILAGSICHFILMYRIILPY